MSKNENNMPTSKLGKTIEEASDLLKKFASENPEVYSKLSSNFEDYKSSMNFDLAKKMVEPLTPKWMDAPEPCPLCGSKMLRSYILVGGPFSGTVKCTACNYHNTVCSHLAKTCISVTPLKEDNE